MTQSSERRGRLAPLRAPLAVKVAGANLLVIVLLLAAWLTAGGQMTSTALWVVLGVVVLHLVLVLVALRPVRDLEMVASRVWSGDYGARVERSSVADAQVLRVGSMFNILLDGLEKDRSRMQAFAAQVIASGERERSALARELRDSVAQQAAALMLQLSAAARDANDPALADRLREARDASERLLEDLRMLSQTVHPSVLDDLGLDAALRKIAREASRGTGIDVDVDASTAGRLSHDIEGVLFYVAQEAVRNAMRHGAAKHVRVAVDRRDDAIKLTVHDDGRGFSLDSVEREPTGVGLSSMRERLALLDGSLEVRTARGNGTTVSASVPLDGSHPLTH